MRLTRFETDLLIAIYTDQAPELINDMPLLEVQDRDHTGHGMYVNFLPSKALENGKTLTLGQKFFADVEGVKHGVGAVLYVDNGTLTTIELYCYGPDVFPKSVTNYSISMG